MVNKALYGLKQPGREWNSEIDKWLRSYGFKRNSTDPFLYVYDAKEDFALVLIYVDDIRCAPTNDAFQIEFFSNLNLGYGLKNQGLVNKYFGVDVEQNKISSKVHQTLYRAELLKKFNFADAHMSRIPVETNTKFTSRDVRDQLVIETRRLSSGKMFHAENALAL